MSSFLVSREGLSILADGLDDAIKTGKIADFPVECEDLEEHFKDSFIEDIFYELNYLNAYALQERYGDDIEKNMYLHPYFILYTKINSRGSRSKDQN